MSNNNELAQELENETIGCRLSFSWFGDKKNVEDSQNADVARTFGASADAVQTAKRLFDPKRPELFLVNQIKNKTRRFWEAETMPHIFRGIRLMKRSNVDAFASKMVEIENELESAVAALDSQFDKLKSEARQRLGALYNPNDYPRTLTGCYSFTFDFPNLATPDYLARLSPELYARESARVRNAFAESQQLAQQLFQTELARCVDHITETLTATDENGRPRIFRDSLTGNLNEFLERFARVSVGNSAELIALVDQARNAVAGITPQALRDSENVRALFVDRMREIQTQIDNGTTTQPARRIRTANGQTATQQQPATPPQETTPAESTPETTQDAATPATGQRGRVIRNVQRQPATPPQEITQEQPRDEQRTQETTPAEETPETQDADEQPQQLATPPRKRGRMQLKRFAVA